MLVATSKSKYIRISAFKVRRIANELINKNVLAAESYLTILPNKGALALKKAVHSARTNLLHNNKNIEEDKLFIKKILVNQGSMFKRFHPIARGRVQRILKRTCHIYVEVASNEQGGN